jgi:3-methyladenine DNA glycosylase AlkD
VSARAAAVLAELEARGRAEVRDAMLPRYGITAEKAWGVPMAEIQQVAKPYRRDHELAAALWETGWYEARMACAFIDDPKQVTPEQMDRWRADFDNWAITDGLCMHLFDRTPHAYAMVDRWAASNEEFGRRAAFALMASLALHRKGDDAELLARLPLIEAAATDGRNFVKKAVSWALRAIGTRRPALRAPAREMAERLAGSTDKTARWVGKDALKAFDKAAGAAPQT